MNRLKNLLTLLIIGITTISCHFSDYESEMFISTTKNYSIKAQVNRTDQNKEDFADVIIIAYDQNKEELEKLNSHAGDANKWSLGWSKTGDTILLQSSDIGNQAWIIQNRKIQKVRLTKSLDMQAEDLYRKKYK